MQSFNSLPHRMKFIASFVLWLVPLTGFSQSAVNMQRVDSMAQHLSSIQYPSIKEVSKYVNTSLASDLEKTRFIFTWIATHVQYDVDCALGKNHHQQDAVAVFSGRRGVCEGYSNLFAAFCQQCNLHCIKVSGICSRNNFANHSWNAVKLNGQWQLLDATWGAGGINPEGQFVQQFNEEFFLMAADLFIQDHLPFDPMWQLLNKPVSKNNFLTGNFQDPQKGPGEFYFTDTIGHFFSLDSIDREMDFFRRAYNFDTSSVYITEGRISSLITKANGDLIIADQSFSDYFKAKAIAFNNPDQFSQLQDRVNNLLDTATRYYSSAEVIYEMIPAARTPANVNALNKNRKILDQRVSYLKQENSFADQYFSANVSNRSTILQSYPMLIQLTPPVK